MHRPEIEGLRAVAALLVAIWHIWIGGVSGGVDVFFVVSGLLITTTLLSHLDRFGRIRPLMFLGRLARRLLPQALIVLIVVAIGTWLLVPPALQERAYREIFASALYFENWQLAQSAVDYLDQNDPHTPVQHFWAMSVQGQFYVIWLVVMLLALLLCVGRASRARRVAGVLIAVLAAASFAYSVWFTAVDQPFAYFSTFTRVWEFALGSLAAFVIMSVKLPRVVALVLGWIGLIAIVICGAVLPVDSSFPGAVALWPAGAALLLLFSGTERDRVGHAPWLLSRRPFVWLGGLSYGIYLWHFPIVIFLRHATGRFTFSVLEGVAIIAASVLLAWVTTVLIERPLRRVGDRTQVTRAVTAVVLVAIAVGTAGGTVAARDVLADRAGSEQSSAREAIEADELAAECFGADAMVRGLDECAPAQRGELLVPARGSLLEDTADVYSCYTTEDATEITTCAYGSDDPDAHRVAIVGNSHAAMYTAPLREAADDLGWHVDTYVGNGCVWGEGDMTPPCDTRTPQLDEALLAGEPYDLLLVTTGRGEGREYNQSRIDSYLAAWSGIEERGTQVVGITDNPRFGEQAAECVVGSTADALASGSCDVTEEASHESPDMVAEAVAQSDGRFDLVDMSDLFCVDGTCPAVIGNVIVYRDAHHVTGTYMETMAPYFLERLDAVLER